MINIRRFVRQLQAQRKKAQQELEKLDLAIRSLASVAGTGMGGLTIRRKPHFSAAAKARIVAAQRARWAKYKAAKKK
jgi:hypothetical protein